MSLIKILNSSLVEQATLDKVISAERFERINGDNGLNFSLPLDEATNALITNTNVVALGTDYFDIARYTKGQNGSGLPVVQVECEHISYRLNDPDYNKEWFTEIGTPTAILTKILEGTGFTVGTVEFSTSMTYSTQQPMSRRGLLMELIALLGGEGFFNGFTISILAQRGSTTPKDLTAYSNITVLSKSVDKRTLDALGNPTIAYQCAITNPVELALGDVVTLGYNLLDIDVTLRIVSISANPYDTSEIEIEVGNYTNALEDDLYRIETSMVAKGATYYGARISPENGFESIRSDKMARTVMNADQFAMQTGDGTGSNWTNKLYFDAATGKYVFDGTLSATMIEALEAEFVTVISNTVIVNNLYTEFGRIANLSVSELDTSWKKITNYLASDTSDVRYKRIYEDREETIIAKVASFPAPTGLTADAVSSSQINLAWTAPSSFGTDQFEDGNSNPMYWTDANHTGMTTTTTDYPVLIYIYEELIKKLECTEIIDGEYVPVTYWGAGDGATTYSGKTKEYKKADGHYWTYYKRVTGEAVTIGLTDNGLVGFD